LKTGKIRYECGISGCSTTKTADDRESSKVTLVLKKQLQTVRAVDSVSGVEKWNFSVGTNEVAFAGAVCQGGFHTLLENEIIDTSVKVGIPEGKVFGVDSASNILWEREFGSPISEAWLVEKGQLVSIDPILNNAAFEDPPSFYVGMHNRQLYVQESHMVRDIVGNALVSMGPIPYGSPPKALGISWKVRGTYFDFVLYTYLST
jgi:translation initiation factor 2-alpha kinase 3